jgi:adenylosuccinate lyase
MSREAAYDAVQRSAMPVWTGQGDFAGLLKADREVGEFLTLQEIEGLFDLGYHTRHVDEIFSRVFGSHQ